MDLEVKEKDRKTGYSFKSLPELREALRRVAFRKNTSASALIAEAIENDPDVKEELEKIKTDLCQTSLEL